MAALTPCCCDEPDPCHPCDTDVDDDWSHTASSLFATPDHTTVPTATTAHNTTGGNPTNNLELRMDCGVDDVNESAKCVRLFSFDPRQKGGVQTFNVCFEYQLYDSDREPDAGPTDWLGPDELFLVAYQRGDWYASINNAIGLSSFAVSPAEDDPLPGPWRSVEWMIEAPQFVANNPFHKLLDSQSQLLDESTKLNWQDEFELGFGVRVDGEAGDTTVRIDNLCVSFERRCTDVCGETTWPCFTISMGTFTRHPSFPTPHNIHDCEPDYTPPTVPPYPTAIKAEGDGRLVQPGFTDCNCGWRHWDDSARTLYAGTCDGVPFGSFSWPGDFRLTLHPDTSVEPCIHSELILRFRWDTGGGFNGDWQWSLPCSEIGTLFSTGATFVRRSTFTDDDWYSQWRAIAPPLNDGDGYGPPEMVTVTPTACP